MRRSASDLRCLTVTAIMASVAVILQFLEFSLPIVPRFLKFDFSDLPAMITAFSLGPVWGVLVELLKNLLHLLATQTSGVGELANFLIGALLVFPAGMVYRCCPRLKGAIFGSLLGGFVAAAASFPVNLFLTYPFYENFMPLDAIIDAYKLLIPAADTLPKALLIVNLPFTFFKGIICTVLTFLLYKRISPLLRGKKA